jgi:hypothetical protein
MSPRGDYCGHLTAKKTDPSPPRRRHSLWYKDVVIYELRVRTFHDSDGDGIGDFAGLTEKLDYLHDHGVTAIWLLPFNPSPLRDGRAAPLSAAGRRLLPPPDGRRGDPAAEPSFPALMDEAADRAARVTAPLAGAGSSSATPRTGASAPCIRRWQDEAILFPGNQGQSVFKDDQDRERYLDLLKECRS